jgi:putative MATE family efflux protein
MRLLAGPILPTLLQLAAPTVLASAVQVVVSVAETWYVGRLGTASLAGLALVFPLVMLMQMLSAGAMGGGVSSAIARALGGGKREQAEAIAVHALVIALGAGVLFTVLILAGGPLLYRALGGTGAALEQALAYSAAVFSGVAAIWLMNTLANIIRGSGNTTVPSAAMLLGAVLQVPLGGVLTLGFGSWPGLGISGTGLAQVASFLLGAAVLLALLLSGRLGFKPRPFATNLQWPLFREILRVGALACLSPLQVVLTAVLVTGLVAPFGTAALAGYGIGARLEFLQVPIVFGLGSAMVAMVGTNYGAGQRERAKRAAWTGSILAGLLTGAIGLWVAFFPDSWLTLFSRDADAIIAGRVYLHWVGPCYGFLGLGVALYFASQGAGHVLWPVLAGTLRLIVALGGGWLAVQVFGGGLPALFAVVGLAMLVYGGVTAAAVQRVSWR